MVVAVNDKNVPAAAVVPPIVVLFKVDSAVGLMVKAPTGDIVTVPVPVGDRLIV